MPKQQSRKKKIVFLKCGAASPEMAARCGDYEDWFRRSMPDVIWDLVDTYRGRWQRPALAEYAGLLVSGSPRSLTEPEPWMEEVADLVHEADRRGVPVLGVCFGHQLIGWAYGARVVKNPRGWELGTQAIELTAHGREDALFRGIGPGPVQVNETHEDAVDETELPAGLRVLAENATTPVQALAAGDHVRGVQFHPEIHGAVSREYCLRRAPQVGAARAEALAGSAADTPDAERVLQNFMEWFVHKG
jgi:GMP synthase (glutamine-hydrolysing)